MKKRSYSGRRKSHPSGSALPTAPPTLPPSTSASSVAWCPVPPPHPPTPLSEECGRTGESEGVSRVGSCGVSFPGGARVVASGGECGSVASSLLGVGVAGPSRSQESSMLARSALTR